MQKLVQIALIVAITVLMGCVQTYGSVIAGDIDFNGPVEIKCEVFGSNTKAASDRIAIWYGKGWRIAYSMYRVREGSSSSMRVCFGRARSAAETSG